MDKFREVLQISILSIVFVACCFVVLPIVAVIALMMWIFKEYLEIQAVALGVFFIGFVIGAVFYIPYIIYVLDPIFRFIFL